MSDDKYIKAIEEMYPGVEFSDSDKKALVAAMREADTDAAKEAAEATPAEEVCPVDSGKLLNDFSKTMQKLTGGCRVVMHNHRDPIPLTKGGLLPGK